MKYFSIGHEMFVITLVELFDIILNYLSLGWCQENVLLSNLCV